MSERYCTVHPYYPKLKVTSWERWKSIRGYEGFYQVSSFGRIRSLPRVVPMSDGRTYKVTGRLLKPAWNGRYFHVVLSSSGKEECFLIHRLVAEAFLGPCPKGMICCHGRNRAKDNRVQNLRWDSYSSNQLDRNLDGTGRGRKNRMTGRPRKPPRKINVEMARAIKRRLVSEVPTKEIAAEFDLSLGSISHIRSGYAWSDA